MLPEWLDVYVAARTTGVTLLGVSLPFLVWRLIAALPLDPRRYCPGPRRGWRYWAWPGAWFRAIPCGYHLVDLPAAGPGEVRCPECGRSVRISYQALRRVSRWRPGTIAVALAVGGSGFLYTIWARTGRWQNTVPTTLLIAAKHGLGDRLPTRFRRELNARIESGDLATWQQAPVIGELFVDLRNDRQRSNAQQAIEFLNRANLSNEQLEERLGSRDHQERQIVASMLRDRCGQYFDGKWIRMYEPSDRLLAVTAEGLAADDVNWYATWTDNAWEGLQFLAHYPERIDPLIERGLVGGDEQQRVLCAALTAKTGKTEFLPYAAPILIEHLHDNDITGDARFAIRSLYLFGPEVVPFVRPYVDSEDAQLAAAARMLLKDLGAPAPTPAADAPRLTILTHHPTTSDYGFGIPWSLRR